MPFHLSTVPARTILFRVQDENRSQAPGNNRFLNNILIGKTDRLLMAKEYGESTFTGNVLVQTFEQSPDPLPDGFQRIRAEEAEARLTKVKDMSDWEVGADWLR
jgi:hypothetical protein